MTKTLEHQIGEVYEWLGTGSFNHFGLPYAGKDSGLDILSGLFGGPKLSGGAILRDKSTNIPPDIRQRMNEGELIPTDKFIPIVLPFLSQDSFRHKPLLLSSFGRVSGEEEGVLQATEAAGHPIRLAVHLDITGEEVLNRFRFYGPRAGRADDTEASLLNRIQEFKEKTVPVLETYERLSLLVRIDAMPEERVVFTSLINALHDRAMEA